MINLTNEEKEILILAFEEEVDVCIVDMLGKILQKKENENFSKIYEKLDKYCEENRLNKKSCTNCFKTFFSLFPEEKEIDI